MGLEERMSSLTDRLAGRFGSLLESGAQSGTDWAGLSGQGQGRGNWLGLNQGQSAGGGLSWRYLGSPAQNARSSEVSLMNLGANVGNYDWGAPARKEAAKAAAGVPLTRGSTVTQGGGTAGTDFGSPTPQQLDARLANTRLQGQGQRIVQLAQQYGVPASLAMAIIGAESSYMTPAGGTTNNFGGLKNANGNGFADFPDVASGLEAVIRNMGSPIYHGLTLEQYLYKYLGGPEGGNVADYYKNVLGTISAFGGTTDLTAVPVWPAKPQAPAPAGGGSGMSSIWGGKNASVTQDYGAVTPGIDQGIYGYGAEYGLPQGHTGLDIGLSRGSQLYMPAGLTGVVTTAGGTRFFRDEDYGDQGTPGKGELRITLSNGDILILGHTSQINVRAGQQVTAGMLLGLSGSASGDHLHLEVRQRQADGSYRLVNPQQYFGQPTGGGGASYR